MGNESDDEQTDETEENDMIPEQSIDNSTAVTRFLIKHLPKQLTQLEDKIHDFETIISEQRMQMAEHERRVEVES